MAKNAFLTQLGKRTATRTAVKNQDGNVQLVSGKAILEIPLEKISEDPTQPRTTDNDGFSEEAISGLADTIVANGLLQPISVHADPKKPGCYIINHGARRFRASKKAGLPTIAAIVDEDYSQQKQLIENLQRENLSLPEIVDSLIKIRPLYKTQRDLAKAIGRSDAWITQMMVLTKLDPKVDELMKSRKCLDTLVLNGLQKLVKEDPQAVDAYISTGDFSRTGFNSFKKTLQEKEEQVQKSGEGKTSTVEKKQNSTVETKTEDPVITKSKSKKNDKISAEHELSRLVINIDGRRARLLLDRPLAVCFEDGEVLTVKLSEAEL